MKAKNAFLMRVGIYLSGVVEAQKTNVDIESNNSVPNLFYEFGVSRRMAENVNAEVFLYVDFNLGFWCKVKARSYTG